MEWHFEVLKCLRLYYGRQYHVELVIRLKPHEIASPICHSSIEVNQRHTRYIKLVEIATG
jgi:hypothetical protein